jgi:four helix bundle protein
MPSASAFKIRTKKLALSVIELARGLPRDEAGRVIGRQLLRVGTSVGANQRAARRARSRADMIAKLKIVEEEADESMYWLELLVESDTLSAEEAGPLHKEASEIIAMTVASIRTLRSKK